MTMDLPFDSMRQVYLGQAPTNELQSEVSLD